MKKYAPAIEQRWTVEKDYDSPCPLCEGKIRALEKVMGFWEMEPLPNNRYQKSLVTVHNRCAVKLFSRELQKELDN